MPDESFNGKDRKAISEIRKAVEDLTDDVSDLKNDVRDVRERTIRIETELGTVDDNVDDHETRVRSLERTKRSAIGGWKMIIFMVSASSVIGGVVGALASVLG